MADGDFAARAVGAIQIIAGGLQVLQQGGVPIPAWARSPFLPYTGVRFGGEITVVRATAATTTPALLNR